MKIKTEDLAHEELAWAVAVADGRIVRIGSNDAVSTVEELQGPVWRLVPWMPQEDWAQVGPLITKFRVTLEFEPFDTSLEPWSALVNEQVRYSWGEDPKVAICRAICRAHFGQYVELPEGLQK